MSPTVDFFQLGVELTQAEHYSQALGAFSQAILHQQHVPSAYSNRCLVQLSLGNYQGAIADCDQALATTPDNPEARLNRGLAYYHLQNYQQAIAEYDALLQQYPQEFRAYYNFSKTGGFDPTQQGYNPIRTIEPCFQRHRLGVYEA
jgi:tetratricopeptide (TPR) repeat protein